MHYGCKVNQYETNLIKEKFEQNNYEVVSEDEKADIYCINSCTVTNMSDRKTRQIISKMKKQNNESIIVLMGCYAETLKERFNELENVDIVIGNENKKDAFDIIQNHIKALDSNIERKDIKKNVVVENINNIREYNDNSILKHGYQIRENVKIEDGCNNFCSYCIIPYVRGRVRSRSIKDIIEEVENLSKSGIKEIVLVGIEVASYGQDLQNIDLIDVIEKVSKVDGIQRVKLSSIEPRILTYENLLRLKKIDKFCEHFHISMQSGSNETLKRMNRKYTKELLIEVSKNIYKILENASITADVIVGFPGETDTEFNETIDTIKTMKLSMMHVFKYSKRKFTRAAKMENQVDGNVAKRRSEILLELNKSLNEKHILLYIGKKVKVLFESYKNGYLYGYTSNYIMVKMRGDKNLCGTIQDVDLISLEKGQVIGKREEI